jgi:hypothetical protein
MVAGAQRLCGCADAVPGGSVSTICVSTLELGLHYVAGVDGCGYDVSWFVDYLC